MIRVRKSGAKYSSIVGISEELRKRSKEEGQEYLLLNRGINAVVNIDINDLAEEINYNSNQIQVYPQAKGRLALRKAINSTYFQGAADFNDIFITNGGVSALDLIFKTIDIEELSLPPYYWGAYLNVLKINKTPYSFYNDFESLKESADSLRNKAVLICDPNNPTGIKIEDDLLFETIAILKDKGVVVIVDSPYRRLFQDWERDGFYQKLTNYENVIVCESFSKSIGLSGQRIGFVYCGNKEFMNELAVNLLFATNGINTFSQILVEKILTEPKGVLAAKEFRIKTVSEIQKNIQYLKENNLLAEDIYEQEIPQGIFVIVNKSVEVLLQHRIGSVPFSYFCQLSDEIANKYSRICVSVPHKKFVDFFSKVV